MTTGRGAALVGLLLPLLSGAGPDSAPAPGDTEPPDSAPPLRFLHLSTLTWRLDSAPVRGFARLTPAAQRRRLELVRASTVEQQVYVAGGRMLVTLPERHPAGPAELLLAEDRDKLVLFHRRQRLRLELPLDQLPSLLDGRQISARSDFDVKTPEDSIDPLEHLRQPRRRHASQRTRTVQTQISYRYAPEPGRPVTWSIRQLIELTVLDEPRPFYAVFQQPLLHLALPALENERGVLVLEALAWRSGQPMAWSTEVRNEAKPADVSPTFLATVTPRGWYRDRDGELLSLHRKGYRPARSLAQLLGKGRQLVDAARLAPLRDRPGKGPFTVHNRTGFAAWLYVDGILLGWVGAGQELKLRGLPEGYYRLYAASPTGIRAWGPHDVYAPGELSLR